MTQEKQHNVLDQINENIAEAKGEEPSEQYLTFFMGKEEFGVNILSVQEIRGWESVTSIPNSPAQVKGVMNLRGNVAPIIDLRMSFGINDLSYSDETVVIILTVRTETKNKIMGVVVDAVSDVHNFSESQIQPSPDLSLKDQAYYVKGLGSTEEKMVILLELNEQLIAEDKHQNTPQLRAG